jgi:hypothetical protein
MNYSFRLSKDERTLLDRHGSVLRNKVFDAEECGAIIVECVPLRGSELFQ